MDETFVKERIGQLVADSGKSEKRISRDLGRSVGYIQSLTSGQSSAFDADAFSDLRIL